MTTAAWFHCFSGIAGDMALGALIDAGADVAEVRAMLDRLPMAGWSMEEVRRTLKIRAAVLPEDPLAERYGCRPWEPWPPALPMT